MEKTMPSRGGAVLMSQQNQSQPSVVQRFRASSSRRTRVKQRCQPSPPTSSTTHENQGVIIVHENFAPSSGM